MKIKLLFLCIFCVVTGTLSAQTIRYVKPVASGTGDGSSWANASANLQLMINNSSAGNEVWVAAGTYKPGAFSQNPLNRGNYFSLRSGVKIYGSFAGNETTVSGRSVSDNPTILSGDLAGNDPVTSDPMAFINSAATAENAYCVVAAGGLNASTVFDGFTIVGGMANGQNNDSRGGGMYISSASGIFSNITIKNCYASNGGGGIYITSSSTSNLSRFIGLTITGCVSGSGGNFYGSAIMCFNNYTSTEFFNLLVTNCVGQSAVDVIGNMHISNAVFYNIYSTSASQYNCVIDANPSGHLDLYNSIIAQHTQTNAIYVNSLSYSEGASNSIYGNVHVQQNGSWTATESTTNTGNPGFIDAANGNFRFPAGNANINAGNDQYLSTSSGMAMGYPAVATDIAGNTRSQSTVDRGVYEFNQQTIRYVKPVASGTGNGSSWANASSDLQLMINNSGTGDQIWVAKGTYKPNRQPGATAITANNRDNTFNLKSGVKIYGSFAGGETTIEGRQFQTNASILSGDFNGNDPNNATNAILINNTSLTSDNAHHVVTATGLSANTLFDGFVLTGGIANGSSFARQRGGGIYMTSSYGQFSNIAIKASRASSGGGGIYINNSWTYVPRFTGLIITGCVSGGGSSNGSAIFYEGPNGPQETKAEFFNMLVTNCAGDNAVYVNTSYAHVYITNATFYGVYTTQEDPIYAAVFRTNSGAFFTLNNSIIAQHGYPFAFHIGASSFVRSYSSYNSVFKSKRGDGTLTTTSSVTNTGDPGFVNAGAGDFNLLLSSPARSLGNISLLTTTTGASNNYPAITTDIAGKPRLYLGNLDIGAYQYHPPCTTPAAPSAESQVFCGPATVAQLTATGTDLKWYAASTGGTVLASATAINTGTYYVSQSNGVCESARTAVNVVVGVIPAAPTASAQALCGDVTTGMLEATGTNLKWYTTELNGTALEDDAEITSGTYYVTQSNANCESTRVAVEVTVNALPPAPGAEALQTFCGSATIDDLITDAPETKWYTSAEGGETLPAGTPLATGTYYASQMNVLCEGPRTAVEVITNTAPLAPEAEDQVMCANTTVADIIADGVNLKWFSQAEGGQALDLATPVAAGTYYVSQNNGCESPRTSVTITLSENCTALAQNHCDATVTFNTRLYAQAVAGAMAYRYHVTNGSNVQVYETSGLFFRLNLLASYNYDTTYAVKVAVLLNGEWSPYGPACNVHTPALATSKLSEGYCGNAFPVAATVIYADDVALATVYRFRVTDGVTTQIMDRPSRVFNISNIIGRDYGKVYTVDVAVKVNGAFGNYGPQCTLGIIPMAVTQLSEGSCGITLTSFGTALYADVVGNATAYRFRVNDGTSTQVIEKPTRVFSISNFAGYTYGKTYTVEVAVLIDGAYTNYGPSCTVTTSPQTLTQLSVGSCGITLSEFGTALYADAVGTATAYRFRVSNGVTTHIVEKPTRVFTISNVPGYTYNTTYTVEVAAMVSDVYTSYGPVCTVTTMPQPLTQLSAGYCGTTVSSPATLLYADPVALATSYRFRITANGNIYTRDSSTRVFSLGRIPGFAYGVTYTIEVAAIINGMQGEYGQACTVTAQNTPARFAEEYAVDVMPGEMGETVTDAITLTAYPNPYTDAFSIEMNTQSNGKVTVRAFDMNGRLVDDISVSAEELAAQKLGGRYAAGVYNVIVMQGNYQKTFKIVKR